MTWGARLRLLGGLVLVLLIVAVATLVFNQRQTQVASTSATISSQVADVGTDYGGLVTEAYVQAGDPVVEGQRLFAVESLQLVRDVETGTVTASQAGLLSDGTYVVRANAAGTVARMAATDGSYVSPGDVLASIDRAGSLFAQAEFTLTPRDFGRLEDGATVELRLPDQRVLTGSVSDITVATVEGDAHVTARIDSFALTGEETDALIKPGTPLEATLRLRDDGPLAGVDDAMQDLASRMGL